MRRQETYKPYISESGHHMLRLLIASYFIGTATGIVPYESGREMALLLFPDEIARFCFSAFIFATAYLILIGRQIRGAALLLALFVFWSSYMASFGPNATAGIESFWRDLALIGGLLLTYANRAPMGESSFGKRRLGNKHRISPRRIIPSKKTPPTTGATMTAGRNHTGYAAFSQNPDDMANMFSKVFDVK